MDWYVWTIVCMLFLMAYLLGLWYFGVYLDSRSDLEAIHIYGAHN